jgi:hypothetical protein
MYSTPIGRTLHRYLYRLAFCLLRGVAINRRTMSRVPKV